MLSNDSAEQEALGRLVETMRAEGTLHEPAAVVQLSARQTQTLNAVLLWAEASLTDLARYLPVKSADLADEIEEIRKALIS